MAPTKCRVCGCPDTSLFISADGADYFRCPACLATFIDASRLLKPEDEKARYAYHLNDPSDSGYRKFLSKLSDPLIKRLGSPKEGLDFGCGTGPALAQMLEDAGHKVSLYDPFFYPDASLLDKKYDFVSCTEVLEHLHFPVRELNLLDGLLKPGAVLAVMTCFQDDDAMFARWHYRRDPTHVVFYKEETLRYIAQSFNWTVEIPVKDVAFFTKIR